MSEEWRTKVFLEFGDVTLKEGYFPAPEEGQLVRLRGTPYLASKAIYLYDCASNECQVIVCLAKIPKSWLQRARK